MKYITRRKRAITLWDVLNVLGDPFGSGVLDKWGSLKAIEVICEAVKEGFFQEWSLHDDDLYPWNPNKPEDYLDPKDPIHDFLAQVKSITDAVGLQGNIVTTCLHGPFVFANGGFTNPDPEKRLLAVKKALRCAWIGNKLGFKGSTYWTARDGFEIPFAVRFAGIGGEKDGPYGWLRQCLNTVSTACMANEYTIKWGTIEPKVNEPRGVSFLPLVGSALAFINTLKHPSFWGVNPEVPQHASMGNQEPLLELVQAVEAGKLFFLHLGNQIDGQFDNDFPPLIGPTNLKRTIAMFLYLAEVGWNGTVEYDCHPMRSDGAPGSQNAQDTRWEFMKLCVEMTSLVESIIVPRILDDPRVAEARDKVWNPNGNPDVTADHIQILTTSPTPDSIKSIVNAVVDPASFYQRALCTAVDRATTLAMFGVTEDDLTKAMSC